jgi:hypothetical protein
MSEEWKKQDRPRPPCSDCGAELYEKFWGNGGWVPTEKGSDKAHGPTDCIKRMSAVVAAGLVLATDVDDMMGVLRDVASIEYTRDEVRDQAKRALDRLKARGVGAE